MRGMSHFDDFLRESTSTEPGSETGLDAEELYGLYISWCALSGCPPESAEALWEGPLPPGMSTRDQIPCQ